MPVHTPADHPAISPCLLVADARATLAFLAAPSVAREPYRKTRDGDAVMHAQVRIEDSPVMIGERPEHAAARCGSTHAHVPDVDACYVRDLAAGADRVSPPAEQPYGDRPAGLRDAQDDLWSIDTRLRG